MTTGQAFVTYVRLDDEADNGRLVHIAQDIAAEYAAITADSLELVVDRDHLHWGDDWRDSLADAIARATFLIAFLTPRFFLSEECRRELDMFQRTATELGRRELVLPILYIDVHDLSEDSSDMLRQTLARVHRVDFREVRFEDRNSAIYRRAIHALSNELRDRMVALSDLVEPPVPTAITSGDSDSDDDAPGIFDLLEDGIDAPEEMTRALTSIGENVRGIGELMKVATAKLTQTANPKATIANRVHVAGQLAKDLGPLVDTIDAEAANYRAALDRSTGAINAMFQLGHLESNRESSTGLAHVLINLDDTMRQAFNDATGFIEALRGIEQYARSLRPPVQRLRRAIQGIKDTEPLTTAWADDARHFLASHDGSSAIGPGSSE